MPGAVARELSVPECGITYRGLIALIGGTWRKLETLNIHSNAGIADAGLMALCKSSLPLARLDHSCHGLRHATRVALDRRFRPDSH